MDTGRDHRLDLPFKGGRPYLHGSDIVPALLALTGPVTRASFQFHRMATRTLVARALDEAQLTALRASEGLFALMSGLDAGTGSRRLVAVVESEVQTPIARVPYDEDAVVSAARLDGPAIEDDRADAGSFMERTLALHKRLLNTLHGPAAWLFSRLDLAHAPVNPLRLRLRFQRRVGSDVFFSALEGDGEALGTVYFTRRASP